MNKKITFLGVVALAFAFATPQMSAKVFHVGTAWGMDKDYDTLQEMITANHASSTENDAWPGADDEIWVAGTQELDAQWGLNTGNVSRWQGKLIGGFAGTETTVAERAKVPNGKPWEFVNPTVIRLKTGQGANQGILMMSQASTKVFTEIDGITFDGVNCTAGVMQFRNGYAVTTLKNCIVENGDATKSDGTPRYGVVGGISIGNPDGNVWQSDYETEDGHRAANFFIDGCLIQNNKGVGVYVATRQANSISNSVVKNNVAVSGQLGGGIIIKTVKTDIINTVVEGNKADSIAGIYLDASSIAVDTETGLPTSNKDNAQPSLITNCTIKNNVATLSGAVIYANSGVTVTGTTIEGNTSAGVASNSIDEGTGIVDHLDVNGNAVTYTPTAINPIVVANAKIYAEAGTLYVVAETAQAVKVYTTTGAQVLNTVTETVSVPLPQGIYIVKVGTQAYKVLVK